MKQFKFLNSLFGWITFAVAAIVYLLTMEPTASFWDCGEFISTAFKLEVGHPPGAALFMIMGRLFTMFAGSDVTHVAIWMNSMSALASAFTILFLFWSITHLARKLIIKDQEFSLAKSIAIIGAGLVGALAYTFSDSFWFSAVEAEVYASSSLFTAVVFWAILKWEDHANDKHSNRWLVLIAYLMGLSIGVHLLNLLVIPGIVFVYYFKKYEITRKGIILTSLIGIGILAIVMFGVIQGLVVIASKFELLFVNGFGLPYSSGAIFYIVLLIALIVWGIIYTYKKGKVVANTALVFLTVLIIGYSSVAMIVIRSSADTPLDENDPDNMFSLLSYLNRDQYGDNPLFYGPTYNAPVLDYKEGKPVYTPQNGKYEITNHKVEYVYDDRFLTFFPRMYSSDADHVKAYQYWANVKGTPVSVNGNDGAKTIYKPTFSENLKFFFSFQVNFMYFRYFMWNFSGRQNDIQGNGESTKGNWISGISFIDNARLGPQDNLPESLNSNKGKNKYYMLPFLLGICGLYYHLKKNKKDFTIVALLFFFTGLAIVLYLNQNPYQPRERDYAYVGSFYAFAIWIGLGVLALYEWLSDKIPGTFRAGLITVVCLIFVPAIMAKENWNDHDRSGRYTARDFAYNYLNSCEPNGIIFTNGDNDTFPLWYAQEVEGIRTDVRVVNLSYFSADWYVEQMHQKAYESDPLPLSLTRDQVLSGKRDIIYLMDDPRIKNYVDLKQAIDFVASDNPETKRVPNYSGRLDYIPTKKFKLDVDTSALFNNGYLSRELASKVVPQMQWTINKNYITKSGLMTLDLLANNNWKRPIYFAITVSNDNYLNLEDYFQIYGLTYKIVPIKNDASDDVQNINIPFVYDNLVNKFKWGGVNDPKVYLDENNLRMLSNFRNSFAKLAGALIEIGKKDSALKVLDKAMEVMPEKCVPFNYFAMPFIDLYYQLNKKEMAEHIAQSLFKRSENEMQYYYRLNSEQRTLIDNDIRINLRILQQLSMIVKRYGNEDLSRQIESTFNRYYQLYASGS